MSDPLWKPIIDRILRTEGTLAFVEQMWRILAATLGVGVVTALVTWLQGALAAFGFAGFVVVTLVVAILIFILVEQIRRYRADRKPTPVERMINFDAAAAVYGSTQSLQIEPASAAILQMAADALIDLSGSKINGTSDRWLTYGVSHKLEPVELRRMEVGALPEGSGDAAVYGKMILIDRGGAQFGRLRISLIQLTNRLTRNI